VRLSDLDYDLDESLIAQRPVEPRDSARLLVDAGAQDPRDHLVRDLPGMLGPGDLLVLNDTRVMPARVPLMRASGGRVELLLLESVGGEGDRRWRALVRPGGRLKPGEVIRSVDGSEEVVVFHGPSATVEGAFEVEFRHDVRATLARLGEMPLPPYVTAPLSDPERYQTVYARREASAAAPTAGLHFTPELLGRLGESGVSVASVELVVGLDTFRPITDPDPSRHRIHTEVCEVAESVLDACERADRVISVGTTVTRALETAALRGPGRHRTDLFIVPGHEWRVVDMMLTNFHMPRTTLLMMIEAFVGPRWRSLYATATRRRYRFLSFGDAMLLDRSLQTS
jgi:S-adenosylmethionine:tRNA ribosyltransferase-isomerase